ncbi:MAG: 8-oxo-dGTP diphosphatase [Clostridia bacterium]|nr:8-oxo-dGTP diphosphatase [Clostridia bacterium]MBQ5798377.1 8-oxo-dGTP diphosphatase [Clostridia bacterium]
MKNTSLCYIFSGDKVLLLHKNVKKDLNFEKWLGVGGKFLEDESPFDCVLREAKEETGLTLKNPLYRGIVTFVSDRYESEQMHLFTCNDFEGTLSDCDEGELLFLEKEKLFTLPAWEGDKIFLELILKDSPFFSLKLVYEGEKLVEHKLIFI